MVPRALLVCAGTTICDQAGEQCSELNWESMCNTALAFSCIKSYLIDRLVTIDCLGGYLDYIRRCATMTCEDYIRCATMASRGKKERGLKQLKVRVFNMGNRLGNDGLGRPPPTIFKIRWAMVVCGRKDGDHHPQSCYLPVMGGRPSTWSIVA